MKVKVTADSTCDLSPELLARYDVTLAPLTVIKDGQAFADGVTITPRDIFMHVAAGGSLCSTAAVSVGEYQALFPATPGPATDWFILRSAGSFPLATKTPASPQRNSPMYVWWIPATCPQDRGMWFWRLAGWGSAAPAWTSFAGSWRS